LPLGFAVQPVTEGQQRRICFTTGSIFEIPGLPLSRDDRERGDQPPGFQRVGDIERLPRLAAELARDVGADPGHLRRLLEFLAASGIVRRRRSEAYALTRFGRGLLAGRQGSLKAFAEFNGAALSWEAWAALDASVTSRRAAFHIAHGE
jgi:hypothetical protein